MNDPRSPPGTTPLLPVHLPQAQALSAALNWPYRVEDWKVALELGHGIAVEDDGRLVATALWWPYDDRFATCGMIIVNPAWQRRGIGAALMDELLRQSAGRNLLLCSTREGRRLYETLGFVAFGQVHQHQAVLVAKPAEARAAATRSFEPADWTALCDVDRRATGMCRERLLRTLIAAGECHVIEHDGVLGGYAVFRRWGRGHVIGPVVAHDAAGARTLIAAQLASQVGNFVRIDVTAACGLSDWLEQIGLVRVDEVTLMVRGQRPATDARTTVFALANQSFG
jgi:GNAT superfamily N-acetyltransferase